MRIDRVKLAGELRRRDMTQKALASETGVSRVTIGNVLAGRACKPTTAQKIAAALGVKLEELTE